RSFSAPFDSGYQRYRRETRVLQNALANQGRNLARRKSLREAVAHDAPRFRELSLLVPPAQAVEFVAADFHVHVLHRNKMRERGDFILCSENHIRRSHRVWETKFLQ